MPVCGPAAGGYTGQVAVQPDEVIFALNAADEGEW
jgi:hypothetical protein